MRLLRCVNARRFRPIAAVGGGVRDTVTVVYSDDDGATWTPLEGASFDDGVAVKIGLLVDGDRSTALTDHQASPSRSGSKVAWYAGDPAAGGTLLVYGGGNRDDDFYPTYDAVPDGHVDTDELGGVGTQMVTARALYPDGHHDDHSASLTVVVPALTIQSGPSATPTASSVVVSLTASTRVASMTVEWRTGGGAWTAVTTSDQSTFGPSVVITGLTAETSYEYRVTDVADIHAQTTSDLTVRPVTTLATPAGGTNGIGGGLAVPSPFDAVIPAGFPASGRFSEVYNEAAMANGGSLTVNANDTLVENLHLSGNLTVNAKRVTIRNCWVEGGISFNGDAVHGVVEHSRIGPASTYSEILADTVLGGNTIDLADKVPNGSYVLASSGALYGETMRVVSSTPIAGGHRHTVERADGNSSDVVVTATAKWLVVHRAGDFVSWHNVSLHGGIPGNGIGGTQGNTGQTSDTESRDNPRNYTVRNCLIAKVNDGLKFGCGLTTNTVIMEQIFIPPAHLDGAQWTGGDEGAANGLGARWIRCTILMTADGNRPMQIANNQTDLYGQFPASGMHFSFNFIAAAQGPTIGDKELWQHNRWGHAQRKGNNSNPPVTQKVHNYMSIEGGFSGSLVDNLCTVDGTPIKTGNNATAGDRDNSGGAVGHTNPARWAPGYDAHPYWDASFTHPDGSAA